MPTSYTIPHDSEGETSPSYTIPRRAGWAGSRQPRAGQHGLAPEREVLGAIPEREVLTGHGMRVFLGQMELCGDGLLGGIGAESCSNSVGRLRGVHVPSDTLGTCFSSSSPTLSTMTTTRIICGSAQDDLFE